MQKKKKTLPNKSNWLGPLFPWKERHSSAFVAQKTALWAQTLPRSSAQDTFSCMLRKGTAKFMFSFSSSTSVKMSSNAHHSSPFEHHLGAQVIEGEQRTLDYFVAKSICMIDTGCAESICRATFWHFKHGPFPPPSRLSRDKFLDRALYFFLKGTIQASSLSTSSCVSLPSTQLPI